MANYQPLEYARKGEWNWQIEWDKISWPDLSGASLNGATLSGVDLGRANLTGANLSHADLTGANLSDADLSRADLSDANLAEADLSDTNLIDADLSRADLSHADLRRTNLSRADFSHANLDSADLSDAIFSRADFSRANLRSFDLRAADLSEANLAGADLRCANLGGANLGGANLGGANLGGANLGGANLGGADLTEADLRGADLTGADLTGADLTGADLTGAELDRAGLSDLTLATGTIAHIPSALRKEFGRTWKIPFYALDQAPSISRSIEFPSEYQEAGTAILSYFATVLRQKYADTQAKVTIERDGLKVTMKIETPDGKELEQIEKTLDDYGAVVRGLLPVEEFLPDSDHAFELKNQLRIAKVQLEMKSEIITGMQAQIGDMKQQMNALTSLVGKVAQRETPQNVTVVTGKTETVVSGQAGAAGPHSQTTGSTFTQRLDVWGADADEKKTPQKLSKAS